MNTKLTLTNLFLVRFQGKIAVCPRIYRKVMRFNLCSYRNMEEILCSPILCTNQSEKVFISNFIRYCFARKFSKIEMKLDMIYCNRNEYCYYYLCARNNIFDLQSRHHQFVQQLWVYGISYYIW